MNVYLVNITKFDPSYGLIALATYLSKRTDHKFRILDINFDNIVEIISKDRPEVVGISAMTVYYASACRLAEQIRAVYNPTIIIGGVHISSLPESMKPCFDFAVIGEGEETTQELLNAIGRKLPCGDIKGIAYFDHGRLVITPERPIIKDLDALPVPDWSFVNKAYFDKKYEGGGRHRPGRILTSRGCPYHCRFCSTTRFWRRFRMVGVQRVCDEIEMLYSRYGVTFVAAQDDMLTVNATRINQMADELEKRGLLGKITFDALGRVNRISDELCLAMKRLNVKQVNFGFESGNERVLKYLKMDDISLAAVKQAVTLCKKHGIGFSGSFVFGAPTETIEEMKDTVEFIKWLIDFGANDIASFVLTPFPATPMWDIALERGRVGNDMDWSELNYEAVDGPLLLDPEVSVDAFKKVYYEGKRAIKRVERKYWRRRFLAEPVKTLHYGFQNMDKAFNFVFSASHKRGQPDSY